MAEPRGRLRGPGARPSAGRRRARTVIDPPSPPSDSSGASAEGRASGPRPRHVLIVCSSLALLVVFAAATSTATASAPMGRAAEDEPRRQLLALANPGAESTPNGDAHAHALADKSAVVQQDSHQAPNTSANETAPPTAYSQDPGLAHVPVPVEPVAVPPNNADQYAPMEPDPSSASSSEAAENSILDSPFARRELAKYIFSEFYNKNLSDSVEPTGAQRAGAGELGGADSSAHSSPAAQRTGAGSGSGALSAGASPSSGSAGAQADEQTLMAGQARPYFGDAFYSFQNVYWPIHCVICLVICTLGIFANVTNIIVLTRPNMVTAVNAILSAMAFSDLIVNISNIPYLMHELSDQSNATSHFSFQWSLYILFHAHTTVTAHTISIWLTCVLATWRYFVVCRLQSSSQRNWSVALAKRTIAAVCFLVPVFCIPNYLSFAIVKEVVEVNEPAGHRANQTGHTKVNATIYKVGFSHLADESKFIKTFHFWIFSCLTKLVPCVLLTFFTTVLIRKLLSARERRLRLATFGVTTGKDNLDNVGSQLGGPPTGKRARPNVVAAAAQLACPHMPAMSAPCPSSRHAATPIPARHTNNGPISGGNSAGPNDRRAPGAQMVRTASDPARGGAGLGSASSAGRIEQLATEDGSASAAGQPPSDSSASASAQLAATIKPPGPREPAPPEWHAASHGPGQSGKLATMGGAHCDAPSPADALGGQAVGRPWSCHGSRQHLDDDPADRLHVGGSSGLTLDPKGLVGSAAGAASALDGSAVSSGLSTAAASRLRAGRSMVGAVSSGAVANLEADLSGSSLMDANTNPANGSARRPRSQSAVEAHTPPGVRPPGSADIGTNTTSVALPNALAGGSISLAACDSQQHASSACPEPVGSSFAGNCATATNVTTTRILSQLIVESSTGSSAGRSGTGGSTTSVAPTKMVGLAADEPENRRHPANQHQHQPLLVDQHQKQYHVILQPPSSGSLATISASPRSAPTLDCHGGCGTAAPTGTVSGGPHAHGNNNNNNNNHRPCNNHHHAGLGHSGNAPDKFSSSQATSMGSREMRASEDSRIGYLPTAARAAKKRTNAAEASAAGDSNCCSTATATTTTTTTTTTNGDGSLTTTRPISSFKVANHAASAAAINSHKRSSDTALAGVGSDTSRGRSQGSGTLAPMQLIKLQAAQRQLNQNETTTRLLIAVMIVFLICEFPAGILAALCAILGQEFFENVYQPTGTLTDLLALINSSVNFILYCFMSTQFRITFYRVVLHCPAPTMQQSSGTLQTQHIQHHLGLPQLNEQQQQQKQCPHGMLATETTDMNNINHDACYAEQRE